MKADFDRVMEFVLRWEGGYVNDPDDPGGETNFGISKRANPDVDIAHLTEEGAKAIYLERYWDPIDGDHLPWPLCLAAMDFAVNSGVPRVASTVKRLKAHSGEELAYELTAERMGFLLRLAENRPTMRKYVRGWMNRVSAVFDAIKA